MWKWVETSAGHSLNHVGKIVMIRQEIDSPVITKEEFVEESLEG